LVLHDSLVLNVLLVTAGLVMLYFGSEWLVRGSVTIARKIHVSQLVIGLTIVAFGTSTPELVVSINAALTGQADISLGNVVGSNIVNIGLILGLSAIIFPIVVRIRTIRKEVPIMIAAAVALILLSLFDNRITQIEGVFLVLAIIAFTYFSYKQSTKEEKSTGDRRPSEGPTPETGNTIPIEYITSVVQASPSPLKDSGKKTKQDGPKEGFAGIGKSATLIAIGLVLLYFGASFTVDNAVAIATSIGISERVVGLTIVAIGTSLPELITSVVAARKKHSDLSIGNVIGSNIFNALAIVGISATIGGIAVNPAIITDYAVMVAFSLILIPIMRTGFIIGRIEGVVLVAAYTTYLIMLLVQ
jgi:cation:H+ antiporter